MYMKHHIVEYPTSAVQSEQRIQITTELSTVINHLNYYAYMITELFPRLFG
jgi:hypothetical protein